MTKHAASYSPEIVCDDVEDARAAVKLACFYFPSVVLQPSTLATSQRQLINDEDIALFIGELRPLTGAGVLRVRPLDSIDTFSARVGAFITAEADNLPRPKSDIDSAPVGTVISEKSPAALACYMGMCEGVATAVTPEVHTCYTLLHRTAFQRAWEQIPGDERRRNLRDALAFETLKQELPNVADLPYEELLELRRKQNDNLIQYRTYFAELIADASVSPYSPEFVAFARRITEDKIQPTLVELRREQASHLKATAWAALLGVGTLGIGFLGHPLEALTTGGLLAAAPAAWLHLTGLARREQDRAAAQERKALAMLLEVRKSGVA